MALIRMEPRTWLGAFLAEFFAPLPAQWQRAGSGAR